MIDKNNGVATESEALDLQIQRDREIKAAASEAAMADDLISAWLSTQNPKDRKYYQDYIKRNLHRPELILARMCAVMPSDPGCSYEDLMTHLSTHKPEVESDYITVLQKALMVQSNYLNLINEEVDEWKGMSANEEDWQGVSNRFYKPIISVSRELRETARAISKYLEAETRRHYYAMGASSARRKFMAHKSIRDTANEQLSLDLFNEITLEIAYESADIPLE